MDRALFFAFGRTPQVKLWWGPQYGHIQYDHIGKRPAPNFYLQNKKRPAPTAPLKRTALKKLGNAVRSPTVENAVRSPTVEELLSGRTVENVVGGRTVEVRALDRTRCGRALDLRQCRRALDQRQCGKALDHRECCVSA